MFHTFPPPLGQYYLFWSYKNGCQNRSLGAKTELKRQAGATIQCSGETPYVRGWHGLSHTGNTFLYWFILVLFKYIFFCPVLEFEYYPFAKKYA